MEQINENSQVLSTSQIDDLKSAVKKMQGAKKRSFQAKITLKYLNGSSRMAERVFGWGRHNVELGLAERRTGIECIGAQSGYSGAKLWEEKHPKVAVALQQLAEAEAQQESTFQTTIAYTRLTAQEALKQLQSQGFGEKELPAASTMAVILNRMGYRLRNVVKSKPKKNSPKLMQSLPISKPKMTRKKTAALND